MNHHYPDNYGYGRTAPGIPGMGYGGGGYTDPSAMARMGQPREGYPHYPVMPQQSGMYGQGGFNSHQNTPPYNMSAYGNYNIQGVGQPSSMMIGNRVGDMSRMSGGNMMNTYYNSVMSGEPHASPQHTSMGNQPPSYAHSQPTTHMQQQHLNMISGQNTSGMSSQSALGSNQNPVESPMPNPAIHVASGQAVHSPSHSMSQLSTVQSSGTYGSQSASHMLPRSHHVPQHPMRHTTAQQNPQEVADNILQMASAYPSNQTVQVPLKSRPAPYHVPRSPHYSVTHAELSHSSPNPHQQQQSPLTCQTSPSPSSSSVKSPTPVLAPIPNPIPSPGISGLRSPCNQGMSPCQRSPSHVGSTYTGHGQNAPPSQCGEPSPYHHGMSPSDVQHYSPCAMTPTHTYPPYNASPGHRNTSMYSPSNDHNMSSSDQVRQNNYNCSNSCSTCTSTTPSYTHSPKPSSGQCSSYPGASTTHMGNNPLMSLQKLVMLPETQVIDPKSVVSDACLSSQDEGPKNGDGPAERFVEGSSHSVGCPGQSSSHQSISGNSCVLASAADDTNSREHTADLPDGNEPPVGSARSSQEKHVTSGQPQLVDSHSPAQVQLADSHGYAHVQLADSLSPAEIKEEFKEHKETETSGSRKSPLMPDSNEKMKQPSNSQSSAILVSEDLRETTDKPFHSAEKKNGKLKEERTIAPSPGVLAEVPVVLNGLEDTSQELVDGVKHHNGFSTLVKAKIACTKRAAQLVGVTPCTIAVGADERAMCERFAFRRNGICRTLRTTRVICNGRNRSDSTGNADSDESLENVSESNFGVTGSPQDGNKKRQASNKRSECKKSNSNESNDSNPRPAQPAGGGSNGCMSYTTHEMSDDDVCYYEGVDSSDMFMNNCSSDESVASCQEVQEGVSSSANNTVNTEKLTAHGKEEKSGAKNPEADKQAPDLSPPPASKRLCRSSGQKAQEKLKALSASRRTNSGLLNEKDDVYVTFATEGTQTLSKPSKVKKEFDIDVKEKPLDRMKFLNHKSALKYPVVVLEKSNVISSPVPVKVEKTEVIDLTEESPERPLLDEKNGLGKLEKMATREDAGTDEAVCKTEATSSKLSLVLPKRKPKKRSLRMKKRGKKEVAKVKKTDEVTDSFKSMKFSRTLDLMKSKRKRDSSTQGPFIRVTGKQSAPDTVAIFTQPISELALGASSAGKRKSIAGAQAVHMVTNLPMDKRAMVPSSRTISQDPWVCAFCGHHSSYRFLGDLFGPYFKEADLSRVESIAQEEKGDVSKDSSLSGTKSSTEKKNKRKSALVARKDEFPPPEEVWVHEACAMWSPGVCLIGSKMYGLDEAVKDARDTVCSVCRSNGAMIGCLHKGCAMKYHFICAVDKDCVLDEENLSLLCPKHKDKRLSNICTTRS
ncbi:uncharacterized protein LOC131951720 [Physella acuta]|uniref:uncharacterized protein LOC131951720 n=1 Tax=Physella acuta TaxID=109671 RepID=UPI0027DB77C4|nr:uncharacterized protein LOC131951720 [Physella acuta]